MLRRIGCAIGAVLAVLTPNMQPASAHTIGWWQDLERAATTCVASSATLFEWGDGFAYAYSIVHSHEPSNNCGARPLKVVRQQAVTNIVYYWDHNLGDWQPCFGNPWAFGDWTTETRYVSRFKAHQQCGSTWYYNATGAYARAFDGDPWHGNWMSSGPIWGEYWHWFDN